jgi:hypothetical protein
MVEITKRGMCDCKICVSFILLGHVMGQNRLLPDRICCLDEFRSDYLQMDRQLVKRTLCCQLFSWLSLKTLWTDLVNQPTPFP